MSKSLYIKEDNIFWWDKVKKASDNTYVNSGTFTWELIDSSLNQVSSGSLTYVAGSNGRWQGTVDKTDTSSLIEGDTYTLEITGSDGAGADGFRKIELTAKYHGADDCGGCN